MSEEVEVPVFVRIGHSGHPIEIGTFSVPAGLPKLFRHLAEQLEASQGSWVMAETHEK